MPFFLFRDARRGTQWSARVEEPRITIGGSPEATITVPDPLLAAREIVVLEKGEEFFLRALTHRKNVTVNGSAAHEAVLRTGDLVRVANTCFVFCADSHPREATATKLESLLSSEVFAPERVLEAIDAAAEPGASRRWFWIALGLCGIATGVAVAVFVTTLQRLTGR